MLTYIMGIPWFFGYFNQLGEGWQWAFISLNLSSGLIIFYESLPLPCAMSLSKEDVEKELPTLPIIGPREDDFDEEDSPAYYPSTDGQTDLSRKSSTDTRTTDEGIETATEASSTEISISSIVATGYDATMLLDTIESDVTNVRESEC